MSCCEKQKYDRLKDLSYASVLTCQEANIRNLKMAVVKKTHHYYGDYYIGIDYEEARRDGLRVLRKFEPGDSMAVQTGS